MCIYVFHYDPNPPRFKLFHTLHRCCCGVYTPCRNCKYYMGGKVPGFFDIWRTWQNDHDLFQKSQLSTVYVCHLWIYDNASPLLQTTIVRNDATFSGRRYVFIQNPETCMPCRMCTAIVSCAPIKRRTDVITLAHKRARARGRTFFTV